MSILRGVAKGLADEQKIDADPRGLDALMQSHAHSLSLSPGVWLHARRVIIPFGVGLLTYTKIGRQIVAVGSNQETARLCGISIPKTTLFVYALAGLLVGLSGVLEFSTLTVGIDPTDSAGLELRGDRSSGDRRCGFHSLAVKAPPPARWWARCS